MNALLAGVALLLAVVVGASVRRASLRRDLRKLAAEHRLHLTCTDRFRIASRMCAPDCVHGPVAQATVRNVLYRSRDQVRDFVFTYEALEGAASPRRVMRVIHARESVDEHEPVCEIIATTLPSRRVIDSYRSLVEAMSTAGSDPIASGGSESVGRG